MKTRHVWLLPPLDVGPTRQGFVLAWRRTQRLASPPTWEAQVLYVLHDDRGELRVEWIPSLYLVPVGPEPPPNARNRPPPPSR